jgi:hypothetical protein
VQETSRTLDETLVIAMNTNPEILTARAKVSLAEAEHNAVRMEVARRIVELWGERKTQTELLASARGRLAFAEEAYKTGRKQFSDVDDARRPVIEATERLSRIECELHYLAGESVAPAVSHSGSYSTGAPLAPMKSSNATSRATIAPLQLPKGPMVEKIRQALLSPTAIDAMDTPLCDLMDYLKEKHGIEIQIDKSEDGASDMPITLRLKDVSLGAAFQAFDDQYRDVKFVIRDYGILATTPERAREAGYYPVVEFARVGGAMGTYGFGMGGGVATPVPAIQLPYSTIPSTSPAPQLLVPSPSQYTVPVSPAQPQIPASAQHPQSTPGQSQPQPVPPSSVPAKK